MMFSVSDQLDMSTFFGHLACLSLIRVSPRVLMQHTTGTYWTSLCRLLSHKKQQENGACFKASLAFPG